MPEHEPRKDRRGALGALYDFLEGPEEDVTAIPLERVLKDLKKEHLDPAPLIQMVQTRLAAARAAESLVRAREERGRLDQLRARASTAAAVEGLRDRARRVLASLSGPRGELAAVYHRKFEEATDADLQSMLDDLELLEGLARRDDDEH